MYRDKKRYGQDATKVIRSKDKTFNAPLGKKMKAGERVFVCSWSDFFHPDADNWRDEAWNVILQRPDLHFLILTKRPERIRLNTLPCLWNSTMLPNVWFGVTAENQELYHERWRALWELTHLWAHRNLFVSYEPALGPLDILDNGMWKAGTYPRWAIAGAESLGPGRPGRTAETQWFEKFSRDCEEARIQCFIKQAEVAGRLIEMPKVRDRQWAQVPTAMKG